MINRFFLKKFGFNAVVLLQFVDRGDMPDIFLRNFSEEYSDYRDADTVARSFPSGERR